MKKRLFLLPLLTFSLLVNGCDGEAATNSESEQEQIVPKTENNDDVNPIIKPVIEDENFKITFANYDNSVLSTLDVKKGETPAYEGTPTRAATDEYTYTFSGWEPAIAAATKDITYVAQYTENEIPKSKYTITWKDYDGTVLKTDTIVEGSTPSYGTDPTRAATDEYTYTFSGWEPAIANATADATYVATYTSRAIPKLKTIAEVRTLCEQLTGLNEAGIKVGETLVKIQGWAFHKMTLVKTTKKFGYDVSYPNKVFLGDSTGYIACASNNNDHSLYHKLNDYAGNAKSKYEVTGYISMYMNQPELVVPDNGGDYTYFTYNENLSVTCDLNSIATTKTIEQYYEGFNDVCYNCAGHGYKDIVIINNVSILDSVDSDTYIGTDGEKIIKIKKGNCSLSKDHVYNILGLVQTNRYVPSINVFSYTNSTAQFTYLKESAAKTMSIQDYIKEFAALPYDDSKTNFKDTIKKFQYAYKINGYVSAYNTNGKLYATLEPNYNNTKEYPTRENAICVRGAVTFRNDNCWNRTEDELIRYACVGDYLNENVSVDVCVSPILFENMTYNSKKYHELKNYVFKSLVPEFPEND